MSKSTKQVASQLSVWEFTKGDPRLVGTLDLWDKPFSRAEFRYADSWLHGSDVFALDPINLPLSSKVFVAKSRFEVVGAVFDAAPDAWGRSVMASSIGSHPSEMPEREVLLIGRGSGVGALGFSNSGTQLKLPDVFQPTVNDIEDIYEATKAVLVDGGVIDDALAQFVTSSWDIGGARPKAEVVDKDGRKWIAKFPGRNDPFSCQRVEYANLEMARKLNLQVPKTQLIELSSGDAALLVERFDRNADDECRKHYLSAVSIISPPSDFDKRKLDDDLGAAYFSYQAVTDALRKVGSHYGRDAAELFARMTLNVALHNVDDHLKNHGFIKDGDKYRLSPLFDVVTQRTQGNKHSIHIGPDGREGTLENVRAGGLAMRIKESVVDQVIEAVKAVVADRNWYYKDAGLSDEEIALIEPYLCADFVGDKSPEIDLERGHGHDPSPN